MTEKRSPLELCAEHQPCVPVRAPGATGARSVWTRVASAEDVPLDEIKAFTAAGVTVLVAHTAGGFRAVQALCPHELMPLAVSGHLKGETLTCVEHLWQFDLRTGAPLGEEALEGLRTYPIKDEGGQLYVAI